MRKKRSSPRKRRRKRRKRTSRDSAPSSEPKQSFFHSPIQSPCGSLKDVEVPPDEFRLSFFKETGYVRKLCPSCGLHYWTLDPDAENCGDAPCVDYTFIGNSPVNRPFTVAGMREKFLGFFEERGHLRVSPYPVVARWRDDLMITIASIIDFQPYVTEGILPPPGNPLVISQPCIRFEDIDLAGYTAGRHLTFFEMGGHHAFNYQGEPQIYWKDQTVRYHHELLTRDLGVPDEMVTYKEGLWSGGGNAGFDLEGCVGGLEVSTLVFMMYRVIGERMEPMPIQVVDTGYGIERWAWLSQGSPSAFHAIYGPVLDEIMGWAGLSPDVELLQETAKYSCRITSGYREAERRKIASLVGIDFGELDRLLTPVESIYAALDHSKSLAFILSEGVVPSNVREGYLARLLYRRIYRLLRKVGIEHRLPDLVDGQITFWGGDFPQLRSMSDEIQEMIAHEGLKYQDTLSRGSSLVKRYVKGRKEIPSDQLVEFYDSHGLTPDDVSEAAADSGVEVSVPDDFYSLVAMRHLGEKGREEDNAEAELATKVEGLEGTRRLFYEDPYIREFEGEVAAVIDGRYVILDQTGFYAEGGGQVSDRGILEKGGEQVHVKDVQSVEGVLLHEVDDATKVKAGDKVKGSIDWERRMALMRAHTATHLVLGAARRVLGDHAWQSGAQKGVETSRLDISHYKRLTREQVEEIERLANTVVREGRPVACRWMQRDEAEAEYGFRLYQGGAVPGKEIRIVEVEGGWDVEACGGTHLANTSEAGLVKIVNTERVQDGIERLIYAVGPYALEEVQRRERSLMEVSEILGSPLDRVVESVHNTVENARELRKQLESLQQAASMQTAEAFMAEAVDVLGVKLIVHHDEADPGFLIEVGNALEELDGDVVAVMLSAPQGRFIVKAGKGAISKGAHAGRLTSKVAEIIGGRGGGQPYFGQGGGGDPEKFRDAGEAIKKALKAQLG
jgi:alanyl-tRNA synthetase